MVAAGLELAKIGFADRRLDIGLQPYGILSPRPNGGTGRRSGLKIRLFRVAFNSSRIPQPSTLRHRPLAPWRS
jgi:hypothetical protein